MTNPDDELQREVAGALREVRKEARSDVAPPEKLSPYHVVPHSSERLEPPAEASPPQLSISPDRSLLNKLWDVSTALASPPSGGLGRLLSPLRRPLQRTIRFALGPFIERQVEMNSAQVKFDNELIEYLDARLDRMSSHYDQVIGQQGKRMEEIDERHLILQQELIQHVHDLVKRIDFVFESAEKNHLYLEGFLREVREELDALVKRLETGQEKL